MTVMAMRSGQVVEAIGQYLVLTILSVRIFSDSQVNLACWKPKAGFTHQLTTMFCVAPRATAMGFLPGCPIVRTATAGQLVTALKKS